MAEEKQEKPNWMKAKPAEVEKIIIDLAKEGNSPAKIGLILRDKHGIPKVELLKMKITDVLNKEGIVFKTEKNICDTKIEGLKQHIAVNKHDYTAKRSIAKQMWKIKKLSQ